MSPYCIQDQEGVVLQPERSLPVAGRSQVLVIGGGTAGLVAALAAARNGAEVRVLERNSCLGGTATAGMMGTFVYSNLMAGLPAEIVRRLAAAGEAEEGLRGIEERITGRVPYDPEALKLVALRMLEEANIALLLNTWTVDAIVESGSVRGVVVENKSGRQAFLADVVIDCTGDGDLAALAGADYEVGRPSDGFTQLASLLFRLGNVDVPRAMAFARENASQFQGGTSTISRLGKDVYNLVGFFDMVQAAKSAGEIDPHVDLVHLKLGPHAAERSTLFVTASKIAGINPVDAEGLTRGQVEGHKQILQIVSLLRTRVPGFERCYVVDTASMLGVRDSRRILGDYVLTEDDIIQMRVPDDTVALNLHHGPPVREWSRYDQDRPEVYATERKESDWPIMVTGIPYGCLLPRGLEGLLVSGRCFSATWGAQGRSRSMTTCMALGQAAGTAAALASTGGVTPRGVDVGQLRGTLLAQGALLSRPA